MWKFLKISDRVNISIPDKGLYLFGGFIVDPLKRVLLRDGVPIALSPKVFDTLLYLIEHADRLLDKDEMLEGIWPGRVVEENNLSHNISLLRKVLNGADNQERCIVTAPGHGYRFTAPLQSVPREPYPGKTNPATVAPVHADDHAPATAPEVGHDGAPVAQPASHPRQADARKRRVGWVAAAAAAIVVAAAGVVLLKSHNHRAALDANSGRQPESVVLADFQNDTGDTTFDTILGKVLDIDLTQSPFLTILPSQQVQKILQLMTRKPGEKLTPDLAAQVCSRAQASAVLSGMLAAIGNRYVITLSANDCDTGQSIVQGKAETSTKEGVLQSLDDLTAKIRKGLGESPASIHRFGIPLEQATTSSFDALKAYSLGEQARAKGDNPGALPLFERAIALDPKFALAFLALGATHYSLHEHQQANAFLQKAFELKDRVSEHERLEIVAMFQLSLGNTKEMIENYKTWTQTYPQDWAPWANLANLYTDIARYPDAIEAGNQALRLRSDLGGPYVVLARAYKRATQFGRAKAICAQAVAKGLDGWDIHGLLYEIANAEGDTATMAEQVAREAGKPTQSWMLDYEGTAAAGSGKVEQSRALFAQAINKAQQQRADSNTLVSALLVDEIDMLADLGFKDEAKQIALQASGLDDIEYAPLVLAQIGDVDRALAATDERGKLHPVDTIINAVDIPAARAAIDLQKGLPAAALQALQPAVPYELRDFEVPSLLGQAYLDLKMPDRAATEYRKILANLGVDGISPLFPLAHLGLARADMQMGDETASRQEYQAFFTAWKDADANTPVLKLAREEYSAVLAHR